MHAGGQEFKSLYLHVERVETRDEKRKTRDEKRKTKDERRIGV